ncbi:MAG: hypothetical protein AB1761_17000 [Pseudomonadota bacterium]
MHHSVQAPTHAKIAAPDGVDLKEATGTPLKDKRLGTLLVAGCSIPEEIARLWAADLSDIHPVVIFDPSGPYRRASG